MYFWDKHLNYEALFAGSTEDVLFTLLNKGWTLLSYHVQLSQRQSLFLRPWIMTRKGSVVEYE